MRKWGLNEPSPPSEGPSPPSDGDDTDYEEGEPVYEAEVNVYERVGMSQLGELLQGVSLTSGKYADLQRKINNLVQDPVERFQIYVDAAARRLTDATKAELSEEDIAEMLRRAPQLKKVDRKNAPGYVLGYLATRGGREMERKRVLDVIQNVLPDVTWGGVQPPDVIRYSRLWAGLRKEG